MMSGVTRGSGTKSSAGRNRNAWGESRSGSDLAACSATIIGGGQREIGAVDPVFGHYALPGSCTVAGIPYSDSLAPIWYPRTLLVPEALPMRPAASVIVVLLIIAATDVRPPALLTRSSRRDTPVESSLRCG